MRARVLVAALAAAIGFAASLRSAGGGTEAREAECPVDGSRFRHPVVVAENQGGGEDSDGCRYAVAADGTLYVPATLEVVRCPQCKGAFLRRHLGLARRQGDLALVQEELARSAPPEGASPDEARFTAAAATYRALGPGRFGLPTDAKALEGLVFLAGAWAARARAVAQDAGFAPASLEEAEARLARREELANGVGASGAVALRELEDALGRVEEARDALEPIDLDRSPSRRLVVEAGRDALNALTRALLTLKAARARELGIGKAERQETQRQLALAVARGAIRQGDAEKRDQWLARAVAGEVPAPVAREIDQLRRAIVEEGRLLSRASDALEDASWRAQGAEKARVLLLAGDAARRRNDLARARVLLGRGRATGDFPAARRAGALLMRIP